MQRDDRDVRVVRALARDNGLSLHTARLRLRGRVWPILQTAIAAVAAWYLAKLILPEDRPVFATIAAVICLGATYGKRHRRALELIGGVVLGIGIADLLLVGIGTSPARLGVLMVLAMGAGHDPRRRTTLVTKAGVSAILLVLNGRPGAACRPSALRGADRRRRGARHQRACLPQILLLTRRSAQALFGSSAWSARITARWTRGQRRCRRRARGRAPAQRRCARVRGASIVAHRWARWSPPRWRAELKRSSRARGT